MGVVQSTIMCPSGRVRLFKRNHILSTSVQKDRSTSMVSLGSFCFVSYFQGRRRLLKTGQQSYRKTKVTLMVCLSSLDLSLYCVFVIEPVMSQLSKIHLTLNLLLTPENSFLYHVNKVDNLFYPFKNVEKKGKTSKSDT